MEIILKLKDGKLTNMRSYLETNHVDDYYGGYDEAVQIMYFRFDNGEEVHFENISEDYADFCYITSFFYGKTFEDVTIKEFCDSFAKYVCCDYETKPIGNWK